MPERASPAATWCGTWPPSSAGCSPRTSPAAPAATPATTSRSPAASRPCSPSTTACTARRWRSSRPLSVDDLVARRETPAGATVPAWKWLRSMVEHEAHHRGQLYTYLGLLGVPTPPLYGLTEEEVKARSLPR
ncbi:MAG TPA: DinB family protein [Thermoanaerobaculia bacterium]|nr:DinB family protein [Thermoanaerobaculia bacterium]